MRVTFSQIEIGETELRMAEDLTSVDFFRDGRLVDDPYPFYEALRNKCPVSREDHHGVTMVTGWQEAVDVYNDEQTFSSCISVTGPFPGFPVPLEGDDVTELIEKHRDEIPFSDQLPTLDPPTHTNHRALLMRLITPKRLKENEDAKVALGSYCNNPTYYAFGVTSWGRLVFCGSPRRYEPRWFRSPEMHGIKEENSFCPALDGEVAQAPDGLFLTCVSKDGSAHWERGDL